MVVFRIRAWSGLAVAFCASLALASTALAATRTLIYAPDSGYSASGVVTFDDALVGANQSAGAANSLDGLTSLTLTITGPGFTGGQATFHKTDLYGWFYQTDSAGNVIDLNFFDSFAVNGCGIDGVDQMVLGVYCDDGTTPVAFLELLPIDAPAVPVPALRPALLAALAAGLCAAGMPWLRRRHGRARRP